MAKLKKIGVLSLAKVQAVVMTFVGLIAGIVYSFGGAINEAVTGSLNSGTGLAFLALIWYANYIWNIWIYNRSY